MREIGVQPESSGTGDPAKPLLGLEPKGARYNLVSDRMVGVIVWISALILFSPVLVFLYVFFLRNRLLGSAPSP